MSHGQTVDILAEVYIPSSANPGDTNDTEITVSFNPSSIITVNTAVLNPLYVRMVDLKAVWQNKDILVSWVTGFEAFNVGFNVYLKEGDSEYIKANETPIPSAYTVRSGAKYTFLIKNADPLKLYLVKVEDIGINGNTAMHGPVTVQLSEDESENDKEFLSDNSDQESADEIENPSSKKSSSSSGCLYDISDNFSMFLLLTLFCIAGILIHRFRAPAKIQ